ncbi:hypothetical protein [Rudaea sp.]|uniref:hypothetical protein n=1 Tax=Rudaea sp. TaxID=2136325 RepID=UPI002ED3FFE7
MWQEKPSLFSRVEQILTMDIAAGLKTRIVPNDGRVRSAILRILTMDIVAPREKAEFFYPGPENKKKILRQLMIFLPIAGLAVVCKMWLIDHLKTPPPCDSAEWARWWLISATFVPTVMAAFVLPQAIKMLNAKQWPLPDAAVFRPTRLVKGKALKRRGAWLLAWCGLFMPFPLYSYFLLQHGAGFIYDGSVFQHCKDIEAKKIRTSQVVHEQRK